MGATSAPRCSNPLRTSMENQGLVPPADGLVNGPIHEYHTKLPAVPAHEQTLNCAEKLRAGQPTEERRCP